MRALTTWLLRLRPESRSYPSGVVVEAADLKSISLRDEIFQREVYRRAVTWAGEVRTVIDLGCNAGFFCCYLRHYFGRADFRGFGIDVDLEALERADRNLNLNSIDGVELFRGLVGGATESSLHDFYLHASNPGHSQFSQMEPEKKPKGVWTSVELSTLIPGELWRERYGEELIDLLKIDLGGAEGKLLQTDPALFWQTKCMVLKWYKQLVEEADLFPALSDFGFTRLEKLETDADTELWFFSRETSSLT